MTIIEVMRVLDLLDSVLSPDTVHSWLFSANPAFGTKEPAEIIASGETQAVEAVINNWIRTAGS